MTAYGMGWGVRDYRGALMLWHLGSTPGWGRSGRHSLSGGPNESLLLISGGYDSMNYTHRDLEAPGQFACAVSLSGS